MEITGTCDVLGVVIGLQYPEKTLARNREIGLYASNAQRALGVFNRIVHHRGKRDGLRFKARGVSISDIGADGFDPLGEGLHGRDARLD